MWENFNDSFVGSSSPVDFGLSDSDEIEESLFYRNLIWRNIAWDVRRLKDEIGKSSITIVFHCRCSIFVEIGERRSIGIVLNLILSNQIHHFWEVQSSSRSCDWHFTNLCHRNFSHEQKKTLFKWKWKKEKQKQMKSTTEKYSRREEQQTRNVLWWDFKF